MTVEIEEGVRVRITRTFHAPPERIWEAFVDPDLVARWLWGAGAPGAAAEADLRVGGRYRVRRDAPGDDDSGWDRDEWAVSGVFVEIDPPRRLVYTIHWEGPVGYNQTGDEVLDEAVVVELEAGFGGTEVTFLHVGIPPDGVSAQEHGRSVDATFDDLARIVES